MNLQSQATPEFEIPHLSSKWKLEQPFYKKEFDFSAVALAKRRSPPAIEEEKKESPQHVFFVSKRAARNLMTPALKIDIAKNDINPLTSHPNTLGFPYDQEKAQLLLKIRKYK